MRQNHESPLSKEELLARVKAPTLSERAARGDEKAQAELEEHRDRAKIAELNRQAKEEIIEHKKLSEIKTMGPAMRKGREELAAAAADSRLQRQLDAIRKRIQAESLAEAKKEEALKPKKYQGPTNKHVISRRTGDESYEMASELQKIEKQRIRKEKTSTITSEDSSMVAGEIANKEKLIKETGGKRPMDIGDVLNRPVDDTFKVEELKTGWKHKEAMEERVKNAPLVKQAREAKKTSEFLDDILEKRARGIEKRLAEIRSFFKGAGEKEKHKMLMGKAIEGWFKWKAKRLQKEYQSLYSSPVYKKWLSVRESVATKKAA